MSRYRHLMVPWDQDTPDARGFFAYADQHYLRCITMAEKILRNAGYDLSQETRLLAVILDKLTSPLVYLYETWEVLPPETKMKYSPELAEIHEESKRLAEEAFR